MKKILMAALLLIMSSQALFADEDKPELSFYGFADLQGVRESHRHTDNSSYISLSEVLLGMTFKPTKLIEVYIEAGMEGDAEGTGAALAVNVGAVYGKITFSEKFPVYIKVGKWELEYTQSRLIFPFVSDSYITQSAMQDTGAIEIGYDSELIKAGFGVADIANDKLYTNNTGNDIDDIYAFVTVTPGLKFADMFLNLGYVSHTGDSAVLGGNTYTTLGKSGGIIAEFMIDHKWFHFLGSAFFKLGDSDSYNPVKAAYRIEAGAKYKGLFVGAFYDINSLTNAGKGSGAVSRPWQESRIGGLIGYEMADGAAVNLEAWDQSYNSNVPGRHDTQFTLQFVFEGDFKVKLDDE